VPDEISLSLPNELLKRLLELASETGLSVEELVAESLDESLQQAEDATD